MHKLSRQNGADWEPHHHDAVYAREPERLRAALPGHGTAVFLRLAECLAPPYTLLYVLHTPRGEAEAGRYQSPPVSLDELSGFLERFAAYLGADSRFDLWLHTFNEPATVVWDRHDLLFAYGPLALFRDALEAQGFTPGDARISFAHQHHYRAEFDEDARALLNYWHWQQSPLRPEDEQ